MKRYWQLYRGRTYAVCPACHDRLRKRAGGRWKLIEFMLWMTFGTWFLHGLHTDSVLILLVVANVLNVPWDIADRRLYRSYWMWRHPLRCQHGGHAKSVEDS